MRLYGKLCFRVLTVCSMLLVLGACERACDKKAETPTENVPSNPDAAKQAQDPANLNQDIAKKDDLSRYKDQLRNDWAILKDKVKAQWDKITDEDLAKIEGQFDELSLKLQEKYQKAKEEVDQMIKDFIDQNSNKTL